MTGIWLEPGLHGRCPLQNNEWNKLEVEFHTALGLSIEERERYLSERFAADSRMLGEVHSLITAFDEATQLMAEPVFDLGLQALDREQESSLIGEKIGPYRIDKKLGVGGMGEVYLGKDLNLERYVALKFLNSAFLNDQWARRQLVREARAVAMLDHPNICPVFGFEEIGEYRFIVMQYIEGKSLSEVIAEGKMDSDGFERIAWQITDAIATAHAAGIIHRDIKPGNIMLTDDFQIKVLDFGLAKIIQVNNGRGEKLSNESRKGLVLGTISYMSPEQLRAEKLDYRSDIFSLGTVLYELSTGNQPFAKGSDAETITAILTEPCAFDTREFAELPGNLQKVISKCLEKQKENRYSSTAELLLELQVSEPTAKRHLTHYYWKAVMALLLLFSLVAAGIIYFQRGSIHSLAVLPFSNDSGNSDFDYLTDGLAERLIQNLSASEQLTVKPFTTVSGYSDADALTAGRKVSAEFVLSGRIVQKNDKLFVRIRVLDARRGITLRSWENSLDDLPTAENEIVKEFMDGMDVRDDTVNRGRERMGDTTQNGEAFRQYLIGRFFWRKRDKVNIQKSIAAFQQSIDLDPGFARPYAGLADSYVLLSLAAYGGVSTKEAMTRARAAAKQALEIDPFNAEAHTSLGILLTKYDWNWPEAEKELRLAVEMDRDYAAAHYWLSDLLAVTGRAEESIREAELARELDPFSQQTEVNLARTLYYAREYEKALEVLLKAQTHGKVEKKVRYMIGLVQLQKGMYSDALKIFQEIASENKLFAAAEMGYAYARLGRRKEAVDLIEQLKESDDGRIPSEEIAFIYTGLNDKDKAFFYLDEAYRARHAVLIGLKVEPLFDPLRGDKRFNDLLQKMSL